MEERGATWVALRTARWASPGRSGPWPSEFAIFDGFPDDEGRQAHLNGRVAAAVMARADELFSEPPDIRSVDILAAKL